MHRIVVEVKREELEKWKSDITNAEQKLRENAEEGTRQTGSGQK